MKEFSEIKAFDDRFTIFHLPEARIIGKGIRNGGSLGNTAPDLWNQVFTEGAMDVLMSLPHILEKSTYGWTCDYDAETDTFMYIVCVLTPSDTPVPEGFIFRDIPETFCAKGIYGENVSQTIERIQASGYTTNWEPFGWNAELYIQAEEERPPKRADTPWHWIVPVKKSIAEIEKSTIFTTAVHGETLIKTMDYHGITMELTSVPTTIWCGSVAYASNTTDEPDIADLLQKYQQNCQHTKLNLANPNWDSAISIDYWQNGRVPRGMMFAQQVTSDQQNFNHDIYRMPSSLYVRLACTNAIAQTAFGRNTCEVSELFGIIKDALQELGYTLGTNGAQEFEIYNHSAGLAYAYVQVEEKITP